MTSRETISSLLILFSRFTAKPVWTSESEFELGEAREDVEFSALRALSDAGFVSVLVDNRLQALYDSGQSGALPKGGSLILQVPRRWGHLVVARNFDDLLSLPLAHEAIPTAYLVCDIAGQKSPVSFIQEDPIDILPDPLDLYHNALNLWILIKSFADHTNESGSIFFFGTRRIELAPGFSKKDLVRPHWTGPILEFMTDQDRAETRREILLAVLSDMLRDQKPEESFRYLLGHTDVLRRQLKEGMAIYLAEHSPEKLASEARASALAFSETLEKIIAGLEAKVLTIPAAILLSVKDIQGGLGFSGVNMMILLSLAVFGGTMWTIHLSQHDLIGQLLKTIDSAIADLKRKGLDNENPVLKDKFSSLRTRAQRALIGSDWIRWAGVVPLISMLVFAFFGHPQPPPLAVKETDRSQKIDAKAVVPAK